MMHPRPYLSWSQLELWEASPDKYIERYLMDEKNRTNRGQAFGKQIANALEEDEDTGDMILDFALAQITDMPHKDATWTCVLRGKDFDVALLARVDRCTDNIRDIVEVKSGPKKYTKRQVDEHGQITFYATMSWIINVGKLPASLALEHLETSRDKDEDGNVPPEAKIRATGKVYKHYTTRSTADILKMMVRMRKAWREIGERYEKELLG